MLQEASHKEIWAQLKSGNQDALLALYNKYYTGLINYGLRLTGDRSLTNDAITQVLYRLWDRRNDLPAVNNPRSYLITCLRHELFAERRSAIFRAMKVSELQYTTEQSEPSYEEYLVRLQSNKALKEKLARALDELTDREKELLKLRYFEDMDYDEISLKCNITKRTAYNIIHAALKRLKQAMSGSQYPGLVYDTATLSVIFLLLFQH